MLSIHPEVQDFGDENETNHEIDEISKENMNKYSIFIADQKPENTKHTPKYDRQTSCKLCGKKNELREVKAVLFALFNLRKREKWRSVQTFHSYVFLTKRSAANQPKGFNGEFAKRRRL